MFKFLIICILLIQGILTISEGNENRTIPVIDIYYESLCPETITFMWESFHVFQMKADHDQLATVNIYPHGNAEEKWNSTHWEYKCEHGENECFGNVLETCILNKMHKNKAHETIICIQGNLRDFGKDFVATLKYCVPEEGIRNDLLTCAHGSEGNNLQHELVQKTPKEIEYVPWIVFNGKHDEEVEKKIILNMLDFLCSLEGNSSLPVCEKVPRFLSHA
jgi:interferon gamma-inducible protein 30